jgi:hypothetical protein
MDSIKLTTDQANAYKLRNRFNIHHDLKFMYFSVYKNAYHSFSEFLSSIGTGGDKFINNYYQYEHYYKMTTLRHPVDRYISGYFEFMKVHQVHSGKRTNENVIKKFHVFLDRLSGSFYNIHVRPQYERFLTPKRTIIPIDFFFIVERLDEDLELFKKKFNIVTTERFPHLRMGIFKNEQQLIIDHVNNSIEIQEFIKDIYCIDMQIYNIAMKEKQS